MNRYIIVQTSRTALFGAFSSSASDLTADAVASLDKPVVSVMDGRIVLDTSFDKHDAVTAGALAVYRVPSSFPDYVEAEVSAYDVENSKIFEDFETFELVGALVHDEEPTYRVVKRLVGTGPNPESRFVSVESEHDEWAEAVAAAKDLQLAAYEEDLENGETESAYRFVFEVEEV